jgi:geranylgeranyl diphosphate synthase type I
MRRQSWFEQVQEYLEAIEAEMQAVFPHTIDPSLAPFYGMMAYHLGWQDRGFRPTRERTGKRLRPLLCLLACKATTGAWKQALPAAAAVELLHNFTLIHDDIQDHSPLRRGRPTVWKLWGVPQAINAGDGLFVLARMALFRMRRQDIPESKILQAVEILDRAILRICEGQYLDLFFEGRLDVDESAYTTMIACKTAELLETSVHLGVLVGGGDHEAILLWRAFGRALGMAFQIQDDFLGVWGDESHTGKPAAADIYGRKLGLPVVYALARTAGDDRSLLERVYGGEGPVQEEDVAAILEILERVGARTHIKQRAATYHKQALVSLQALPDSPARHVLEQMAQALLGRQS